MIKSIQLMFVGLFSISLFTNPFMDEQTTITNDVNINESNIAELQSDTHAERKIYEKTLNEELLEVGETFTVTATAYTKDCAGCSGITKTGINLNENPDMKVIAVDPSVIPLNSKVYVEGYGYAVAGDTGDAIKGNKIDLYVQSESEAINWGVRSVDITIIDS